MGDREWGELGPFDRGSMPLLALIMGLFGKLEYYLKTELCVQNIAIILHEFGDYFKRHLSISSSK